MRLFRRKSAAPPPADQQAERDIKAWAAAAPARHQEFLRKSEEAARRVAETADPQATYEAAVDFCTLAAEHSLAQSEASDLAYIWPSLTDGMDAPGTGGEEADAAAAAEMKRAANEWLSALSDPQARAEYLKRWSAQLMGDPD